ncbi:MAG: DUF3006 domain-containing protein [Bacillota bacterium]
MATKLVVIDRFEGDWAVLELERVTFQVPRGLVPEEAREGDVLEIKSQVASDETLRRRKRATALTQRLFRQD